MHDFVIVCYMGGTCGDLVAGVIDSTGVTITEQGKITFPNDRSLLKKPHNFDSVEAKDRMLENLSCGSISSHDYEYHADKKHNLLCIGVHDINSAMWAATRFKQLHRPQIWDEMTKKCNATTIDEYAKMYLDHTNVHLINNPNVRLIDIRDILNGNLLNKLSESKINFDVNGKDIYDIWLKTNRTYGLTTA